MAVKLFLKEIRFYTIKETYETITLAPETLLDKRTFVYFLIYFPKKNFFVLCQNLFLNVNIHLV